MPSSAEIPWTRFELEFEPEEAPWVEHSLASLGHEGWEVLSELPRTRWRLYLPQTEGFTETLNLLHQSLAPLEVQTSENGQIRDQDWAENWKAFYHPLPVGEKLLICPSWEEPDEELLRSRHTIRLDPGSAFGTGYHESSRLCLRQLEKLAAEGALASSTVLDYGCGSGILALGALALGAEAVHACDRDPMAIVVARENLELNGYRPPRITVWQTERPEPAPERTSSTYPVVVANLTADILALLAAPLRQVTERHLILGGIVEKREGKVLEAFESRGGIMLERLQENEWVSLRFVFPGDGGPSAPESLV